RTKIRIDMCIQLTDYGDEIFNTVWTVGKELFGPKYPINDMLTMRIEGDREKGRISAAGIDSEVTGSDHAPVYVEFS
ncbi:MAG: hypothetical protein IKR80_05460, partial [Spirochaetales bacterium]|nr:hypothetical protein [Spirochaetales bacterium]